MAGFTSEEKGCNRCLNSGTPGWSAYQRRIHSQMVDGGGRIGRIGHGSCSRDNRHDHDGSPIPVSIYRWPIRPKPSNIPICLQDMHPVSEPVEHRAGEPLAAMHLGPLSNGSQPPYFTVRM